MRHARRMNLLVVLILATAAPIAFGQEHLNSYVYSYWENAVPAPAAYIPVAGIEASDFGLAAFRAPEDIFVAPNGDIYLADTGNDRVVRFTADLTLLSVYTGFDEPAGVFVTTDDEVYIADRENHRIVVLRTDGTLLRIVSEPRSDIIRDDYEYLPSHVVVDSAKRIYVAGPGMYEGIMELDQDGRFSGFLGSNRVQFDVIDYIWKEISTEEQRQGMVLFIPEEFSNLDIDNQGFIYSTTQNEDTEFPVKKHNAEGLDVLKREGYFIPSGDVDVNEVGSITGPSSLVDVAVDEYGMYHVLDAKRYRVFTYDHDGNLLSVFGGPGDQLGLFRSVSSMDILHGSILVLDKAAGRITVFDPTEYGRMLRDALIRYGTGDYATAGVLWDRVLNMNANLEIAYVGLGKIQYRNHEYARAMSSFKLGNSRESYSKAFQRRRKEVLRAVAPFLLSFLLAAVIGWKLYRHFRPKAVVVDRLRYVRRDVRLVRRVQFGLYVLKKPFDGFWDLKYERVGTALSATILLGLYLLVTVLKLRYTGFLFNTLNLDEFNVVRTILAAGLPILLFCVGNWSVSSLMDGSGSIRDIYIATSYALVPVIVIYPIITLASSFLTLDEGAFYYFLESFAYVWIAFLIFVGNKSIHQYDVRKTVGMLALTLVAIGIILFLTLLLLTFLEQMWSFGYSIYRELIFRM